MPAYFFKIGSTDLSAAVDKQSYAVNKEPVYEEWVDGNWTTHRQIARSRYSGSLRLGFASDADFTAFTALLSSAQTAGGYYSITAYVSNTGSVETFDAFLSVKNEEDKWDTAHSRQWRVSSVEIYGR